MEEMEEVEKGGRSNERKVYFVLSFRHQPQPFPLSLPRPRAFSSYPFHERNHHSRSVSDTKKWAEKGPSKRRGAARGRKKMDASSSPRPRIFTAIVRFNTKHSSSVCSWGGHVLLDRSGGLTQLSLSLYLSHSLSCAPSLWRADEEAKKKSARKRQVRVSRRKTKKNSSPLFNKIFRAERFHCFGAAFASPFRLRNVLFSGALTRESLPPVAFEVSAARMSQCRARKEQARVDDATKQFASLSLSPPLIKTS